LTQKSLQWFRREPERQREADAALYLSLMHSAKRQIATGSAQPSIAKLAIEKQSIFGLNDVETAYALSAPWAAGVGTVRFFLGLVFSAFFTWLQFLVFTYVICFFSDVLYFFSDVLYPFHYIPYFSEYHIASGSAQPLIAKLAIEMHTWFRLNDVDTAYVLSVLLYICSPLPF
jgi:hypothetical protein